MPSIQIKHVPEDIHRVLRRRAADAGQSLQEYLLARLVDEGRNPTVEEVFAQAGERAGGNVSLVSAAQAVRADRDAR